MANTQGHLEEPLHTPHRHLQLPDDYKAGNSLNGSFAVMQAGQLASQERLFRAWQDPSLPRDKE